MTACLPAALDSWYQQWGSCLALWTTPACCNEGSAQDALHTLHGLWRAIGKPGAAAITKWTHEPSRPLTTVAQGDIWQDFSHSLGIT